MRTRARKSAFFKATVLICGIAFILAASLFLFNSLRVHAEGDERTEIYGLYYDPLSGSGFWRYVKKYTIGTIESGCAEITPEHYAEEELYGFDVYSTDDVAAMAIINDPTMGICEEMTIEKTYYTVTVNNDLRSIAHTVDDYFAIDLNHAAPFCNDYDQNYETGQLEPTCADLSSVSYSLDGSDPNNRSLLVTGLPIKAGFATRLSAEDDLVFHEVNYKYTTIQPTAVYDPPRDRMYPVGKTVSVAAGPTAEYYPDDETMIPLTFYGWNSEQVDATQSSFVMPDEDVEFYGFFFDATHEDTVTPTGYANDIPAECRDEVMTLPRYYPIPRNLSEHGDTCRGYTFEGWSQPGEDPDNQYYNQFYIFVDGDTTITPSFTPKPEYRVLYALTNDTEQTGQLPDVSEPYYSGEDILLSELPLNGSYILDGWFWDEEGTTRVENNTITVPELDDGAFVTVYGRWVPHTGTLEGFTVELEQPHICDDGCVGPFEWMEEPSFDITVGNESGVDVYGYKVQIELEAQGDDPEWFDIPAAEFCPNVSLLEGAGTVGLVDGKCISDIDMLLRDGQEISLHHSLLITRDKTLMYHMTVTLVEVTPEANEHQFYTLTEQIPYYDDHVFQAYSPHDNPETFASISGGSHPKAFLPRLIATIVTIILIIACAIIASRKRIRPAFRYAALGAIALLLTFSIATIIFQPNSSYAAPEQSASQNMLD